MQRYDLLVIGGGINGVGVARDAAGRGLSVLLCEQNDLGWATSSATSKLIHGGLRYLEHYAFRLVAECLSEREILLRTAPHLTRPLIFVLPHEPHLRPAWMIRAGLFLYDHLGGRHSLPQSRSVRLDRGPYGAGLKPQFRRGFTYSDLQVNDARLVLETARSAADAGALILVRTQCVGAVRAADHWRVRLRHAFTGDEREVQARVVVNAGGPWVKQLLDRELQVATPTRVRLVGGSHIVVPRIHEREHAYILQNPDRRVVFMLPYEDAFTVIGTTEVETRSPDDVPRASVDEIDYLCTAANHYVVSRITPSKVVATWSGVRPLFDDGKGNAASVTRDYHLELDTQGAPVLSIFGGKLTTYRKLAEAVLRRLQPWFPGTRSWTETAPLHGGDFGGASFAEILDAYGRRYPAFDAHWLARVVRRHGTQAAQVLGDAAGEADLGEHYGGGLYQRELDYLVAREWAHTAEDVLTRRTPCGLFMNDAQRSRVAEVMGR